MQSDALVIIAMDMGMHRVPRVSPELEFGGGVPRKLDAVVNAFCAGISLKYSLLPPGVGACPCPPKVHDGVKDME